jgi:hypothetical protein
MANEFIARNGLIAQNNSTVSGSLTVTAGITGSLLGTSSYATTASYALTSTSASYALTSTSASFATNATTAATASYANNFTVAGTLTAQTLVVQTITSSTVYSSGSNIFGNALANTQTFTGSMYQTGSVAVFMGNVGIGTTSPGAKLEIVTPTGANAQTAISFKKAGGYGDSWIETYYNTVSNYGLGFGVASSTKVVINQSGSVGIGTTSPTTKLEVFSTETTGARTSPHDVLTVTAESPSLPYNGFGGGIVFKNRAYTAGIVNSARIRSVINNNSVDNSGGSIAFDVTATTGSAFTQAMLINQSGSVGIGTTNPTNRLHVSDTVEDYVAVIENLGTGTAKSGLWIKTKSSFTNAVAFKVTSGATDVPAFQVNAGQVRIGSGSIGQFDGVFYITGSSATLANFVTNNSSALFISGSGLVGIGTSTPSAKLHVSGGDAILNNAFIGEVPTYTAANAQFSHISRSGTGEYSFLSANDGTTYVNSKTGANIYFRVNNSNMVTITPSGSVGIGTTNPAAKLEVQNGDALIRTAYIGNISAFGTNYASFSHLARTGSGDYSFLSDSNGTTYINAKASNIIYFRINNLDKVIINSSGDLLVGTATSTYNTSGRGVVQANGSSTAIFGLTTGGTDSGYLYHTGTDMQVWNTKAGYTAIGTSNAERMRISSAGDVQIGTTAYATVGGSGYLMVKNVIGIVPDNTANTNNRNWAIQANGQFSGSLDFVTSAASASFPNDAYRVSFTRTGGVVAASFTGSFSGSLSAPGSTTQVLYNDGGAIAASSNFVFSGSNVGIGITNPPQKLSLAGGNNLSFQNTLGGTGTYGSILSYNDVVNTTTPATAIRFIRDIVNIGQDGTIALDTNNTERVRITSVGNVGIGTTNTSSKLHIYGFAPTNFIQASSTGYTILKLSNDSGTFYMSVDDSAGSAFGSSASGSAYSRYLWSTGAYPMIFVTNDVERMRILSGGNVGIGTVSPAEKLQVAGQILMSGTTAASAYLGGIASSWSGNAQYPTLYGSDVSRWVMHINPHISYVVSGSNGYAGAMNGATVRFASDTAATTYWDHGIGVNSVGIDRYSIGRTGVSLMAVSSSGAVGIGTTSPGAKLQIAGTTGTLLTVGTLTNNWAGNVAIGIENGNGVILSKINAANDTNRVLVIARDDTNGATIYGYTPTGGSADIGFSIRANTASYFNGGNVGIGSTNPGYKLDVNGTTRAPKLFLDRTTAAASGISWYSAAYYAWINYMSPAATTSAGPAANVTAPSGTLVTSWALRSYIENASGYGWTFESAANTATPSVVAEIRASDGAAKFGGGVTAPSFTGSLSGTATTASYVLQAVSASYATYAATAGSSTTATSASYAATSSYANNFTVAGTLTAQTLVVQTITSSIVYSSGSNIFGNSVANTQKFTGSLQVTGSTHYLLGNVGIGTTNPLSKLYIESGSADWSLPTPGTAVGTIHLDPGVDTQNFGNAITFGASDSSDGATAMAGIYVRSDGAYGTKMYFGTTDSYVAGSKIAVTIDESQRVGIGSTAPTQGKLVVNGGVYATSFTGSLFGTASYATNALSASYSLNTTSASYANNATSASYAATASYAGAYLPLAGGTMAGTLQMSNQILAFDQSGVRSWGVQASGGELNFTSGDSAGVFDFGTSVNVTGTLTATVKSFIIDHPTKADKKLQYGVLEGPEHSVYVRGKLKNTNYIPLPDYWHALVHQDSITVTITAIGKKQDIWVNEVTEHGIYLGYEGNTIEYFYSVFAERKDIDKLVTEFDKEV